MNVGSLFSGIGGIDLGLERAGMRVRWQSEIDPYASAVLARHWPDVPNLGDVRSIGAGTPRVDILAGGFPCQPVSLAGKGKAQADERWLWPEFARVVGELQPRYVLVENVPGLATRGLGDVVGSLAALGYDAEWDLVSAASVGAPHLRERIFVVAYRDSERPAERWLPEGQGKCGLSDASRGGGSGPCALRQGDPGNSRTAVADADSPPGRPEGATGQTIFRPEEIERSRRRRSSLGESWATEPAVGRVAHGVPRRVDRLRALGNAVVPQVAEYVGRLIMEAEAA